MWIQPKIDWKESDFINICDWNRIDGNIEYLSVWLSIPVTGKIWSYSDFPTVSQANRIKWNLNTLAASAGVEDVSGWDTYAALGYDMLNRIEECLSIIYSHTVPVSDVTVRRCGTTVSGQTIFLPTGGV